jgi:hypothetical protein
MRELWDLVRLGVYGALAWLVIASTVYGRGTWLWLLIGAAVAISMHRRGRQLKPRTDIPLIAVRCTKCTVAIDPPRQPVDGLCGTCLSWQVRDAELRRRQD